MIRMTMPELIFICVISIFFGVQIGINTAMLIINLPKKDKQMKD